MIVGNLATYPPRLASLEMTLPQIVSQVDVLNLCLNEFEAIPQFLKGFPRLNIVIPPKNLKDEGKFIFPISPDDYVFTFDDDIIYPTNYTERMVQLLDSFGDMPIALGVHGIVYSDYFDGRSVARVVYTFNEALQSPKVVNQVGTGTMAVRGRFMPPESYMQGSAGFVDVRFARHACEHGVTLAVVERPRRWLQSIESEVDSLWETITQGAPEHVISEIESIAGYSKLSPQSVVEIEVRRARA